MRSEVNISVSSFSSPVELLLLSEAKSRTIAARRSIQGSILFSAILNSVSRGKACLVSTKSRVTIDHSPFK